MPETIDLNTTIAQNVMHALTSRDWSLTDLMFAANDHLDRDPKATPINLGPLRKIIQGQGSILKRNFDAVCSALGVSEHDLRHTPPPESPYRNIEPPRHPLNDLPEEAARYITNAIEANQLALAWI